jgi:hypothetical protein
LCSFRKAHFPDLPLHSVQKTGGSQTKAAGRAAIKILKNGIAQEQFCISRKEQLWLTRIDDALEDLPTDEDALIQDIEAQYGSIYDKASYGL